jgi:hypothetical protein
MIIKIRYNTNFGKIPNQKAWRVLVNGKQMFTDSVTINADSWSTSDLITDDSGQYIEKKHITCKCKNEDIKSDLDGFEVLGLTKKCSDTSLVTIRWSVKNNKWAVRIDEGEPLFYDDLNIETKIWTSDISPEICCRPSKFGTMKQHNKTKLFLK